MSCSTTSSVNVFGYCHQQGFLLHTDDGKITLNLPSDAQHIYIQPHTHTHPFNGPLSGTTRVTRYQKGKSNLDFTEARDSEWRWCHLGYLQVCTSLQTDNHASTPPLSFLQAGCPSCRPTNSVKALFIIQASNAIPYWVQSC